MIQCKKESGLKIRYAEYFLLCKSVVRFRHHRGPAVFKTLTTDVDNWDGVTSFPCKTVTTIVVNCGGVTLYACKTVTTIVGN